MPIYYIIMHVVNGVFISPFGTPLHCIIDVSDTHGRLLLCRPRKDKLRNCVFLYVQETRSVQSTREFQIHLADASLDFIHQFKSVVPLVWNNRDKKNSRSSSNGGNGL